MSDVHKKIDTIKEELDGALEKASSVKQLDAHRTYFLGKKGTISSLVKELKNLSLEEKKTVGPLLQALKKESEERFDQAKKDVIAKFAQAAVLKKQNFDITAYTPNALAGHLHPYSQFLEEVEDIFLSMGYEILDGPELETDFYNFTALNIPEDHPARDMYDTLWTDKPNSLLRTHTSPVQIHAMQTKKPPIAAIVPGRTYRHEAVDASHDFAFMQCEGFLIDKNVTLSHLFATAQEALKALFDKKDLDIRIRPGFFPFVEPGIEIDMRCVFCKNGCAVCKKSTWIEVFPGGLIHPNVIKAGGLDPNEYSGFAFGFGFSRLAMLKYAIDDIRLFYGGKIKFLEQF